MSKKQLKIRPLGDILLEIEPLLLEAVDGHNLQHGDMYGLLRQYMKSTFLTIKRSLTTTPGLFFIMGTRMV